MPRTWARFAGRAFNSIHTHFAFAGATSVGSGARVFGWPQVSCQGELVIGEGVVFVSSPAPIEIIVAGGGSLVIGDGSLIESGATLRVRRRVVIGNRARIGVGCIVDDDGPVPEEINVAERAWIEDGAVLLAGARVDVAATVTKGAVVGGGSTSSASARSASDDRAARAVERRLRAVIARVVPSVSLIDKGADLRFYKGWDSLAALRVLVGLEKEFAITLPSDLFSQAPRLESAIPIILAAGPRARSSP